MDNFYSMKYSLRGARRRGGVGHFPPLVLVRILRALPPAPLQNLPRRLEETLYFFMKESFHMISVELSFWPEEKNFSIAFA